MIGTVSRQDLADLAQQRSQVYAFLSSLFTVLPSRTLVARLTNGELSLLLDTISSAQDTPSEIRKGIHLIQEYLVSIATVSPDQVEIDLAVERTRLLRGIKPDYGPPPPYESVYRGTASQMVSQTLLEVQRAYSEAGVGIPESVHEPVDYIGLELDLMRHLASREAAAWRSDEEDQALSWLAQQRAFCGDHLRLWIPEFCDRMAEQATLGFYQGVARITKGFVVSDHERIEHWAQ
jgi:putative dimethyl sulfoxide reductase chaperone